MATIGKLANYVTPFAIGTGVAIYGIWALTEAIKSKVPAVNIVRADVVELDGVQRMTVAQDEFDAALKRILK